jgi:hypothetical protein
VQDRSILRVLCNSVRSWWCPLAREIPLLFHDRLTRPGPRTGHLSVTNCGPLEARAGARAVPANAHTGPFSASHPFIRGSRLWIQVSVAAGCGGHEFQLCFRRLIIDGASALAHLRLTDYTNNTCEASLSTWMSFDLRPLIDELSNGQHGEVRHVVFELPGIENTVAYEID